MPTQPLCQAPPHSQRTAQVYGALAKKGTRNLKLMAEGIKKDEGNFDMENDGKQTVLYGFLMIF